MNCGVDARSSGGGEASVRKALRIALAGSVAAAALFTATLEAASAAPTTPSAATVHRKPAHAKREAKKKEPPPKPLEQPLIEVSIARQQLTLYDKGVVIAHAPVSTGMAGHLTPTGIFSVIGKEIFHRSNIYSGAPMPFMQRITWSGVALHAGVLPGYPASHGCIRMPPAFAVRLYHMTQRGARVLVVRNEIAPAPFENARLFTKLKPADKVSEFVGPPAAIESAQATRTAQTQTPNLMSDAVAPVHVAEAPAQPKPPEAPVAVKDTPAAPAAGSNAPAAAADASTVGPSGHGPAPAKDAARDAAKDGGTKDALQKADAQPTAKPASETAAPQTAVPQTGAAPDTKNNAAATGTVLVNPVTVTPAHPIEVQKAFVPKVAPAVAPVAPAPVPATAPAAPAPVVAPAPVIKASLQPYGPERPLRHGPITVFVSKKEGKLYVRKGFQPVFSAPISIVHPEQPLGTHLFTAIEQNPDGVSFRWLSVTMPNERVAKKKTEVVHYVTVKGHKVRKVEKVAEPAPAPAATAAQAIERIDIPEATRERISALMSPGASLIISDQGLGSETGTETDFIVLTK